MTQDSNDNAGPESQVSEWTYVKPKRSARQSRRSKALQEHVARNAGRPRTTDLRSVDQLDKEFRRVQAEFEELAYAKKLRGLVAEHAGHFKRISQAINLGIGSFDADDLSWNSRRQTFTQLAVFLVMIEELGKTLSQSCVT